MSEKYTPDEERVFVERALMGDPIAWRIIVEDNDGWLRRVAYPVKNLGYDVDDCIQYFWMCIYKTRLAKYNPEKSNLYAWLKLEMLARMRDLNKQASNYRQGKRPQIGTECNLDDLSEDGESYDEFLAGDHMTPHDSLVCTQLINMYEKIEASIPERPDANVNVQNQRTYKVRVEMKVQIEKWERL